MVFWDFFPRTACVLRGREQLKCGSSDLKNQLTLAALRCLLQERVTGDNSASTFDLLCLLSSSMVIFVGVRKLLLVHTSSLTVVAAVV